MATLILSLSNKQNLTLTSVVFELLKHHYFNVLSFHLTLTSVVFEYCNVTLPAVVPKNLTLTSVVFEWYFSKKY